MYMELLAEYALFKFLDTEKSFNFYKWALDTFGIPDEDENVSFDFYLNEYARENRGKY